MIECIFTIDYEIYGNGEGSLRELVYEPTEKLIKIFQKWNTSLVFFVEIAELERIEEYQADDAIGDVLQQVRALYVQGFEIGLHLHPQWYNARFEDGKWFLDYSEYNLCKLPQERIIQIVDRAISCFREVLGVTNFTPLSFRAGNWLFQPTRTAANVLAERGIKVDSSVFKGGLQQHHKLDYRRALRNGYYWSFLDHVDVPDPKGTLLELPIYTQMVPCWKMLTAKRIGIQQAGSTAAKTGYERMSRFSDFMRFWYPLKLDYCRMTFEELVRMFDVVIREDQDDPTSFRPVIAIGHTKDLIDFETIESFLSYLGQKKIALSTFEKTYHKCK
jgi:hypothetical protein